MIWGLIFLAGCAYAVAAGGAGWLVFYLAWCALLAVLCVGFHRARYR